MPGHSRKQILWVYIPNKLQSDTAGIPGFPADWGIGVQSKEGLEKIGQGANLYGALKICKSQIRWAMRTRAKEKEERAYRPFFEIPVPHLCFSFHFICLSFPASQNNRKSADKLSDGRSGI